MIKELQTSLLNGLNDRMLMDSFRWINFFTILHFLWCLLYTGEMIMIWPWNFLLEAKILSGLKFTIKYSIRPPRYGISLFWWIAATGFILGFIYYIILFMLYFKLDDIAPRPIFLYIFFYLSTFCYLICLITKIIHNYLRLGHIFDALIDVVIGEIKSKAELEQLRKDIKKEE